MARFGLFFKNKKVSNYIHSFSGILDDIRVYDRTLDSLEIDSLFNIHKSQNTILIFNHPKDKYVPIGENHTLQISALGDSLSYQWYRNAQLLADSNLNDYTIQNMGYSDTGNYYCMLYNDHDTVYSDTAAIAQDGVLSGIATQSFNPKNSPQNDKDRYKTLLINLLAFCNPFVY